ncbi:hypothetical protein [Spiroplasma endosymbiont of Nebria brevicollis]|uniref:hypothetical protein n=1 Tax=Spiroplasma endosymbiont of Nebria brevicollis TaxID=3066284 RepID=UPI00313D7100
MVYYVFLIIKIFVILIMSTPIILAIILTGIEKCKNNNPFGVLILTIGLNIIGTIVGCILLYKNQYPEFRFWKSFWNKIKKMFKWKIKFKRKHKKNIILPQSK